MYGECSVGDDPRLLSAMPAPVGGEGREGFSAGTLKYKPQALTHCSREERLKQTELHILIIMKKIIIINKN